MKKDKDGMPVKQDPISEKVKRFFERKDIGFLAVILPIIAAFVIMLVCLIFLLAAAPAGKDSENNAAQEMIQRLDELDRMETVLASFETATQALLDTCSVIEEQQKTTADMLNQITVLNSAFINWAEQEGLITRVAQ